MRAAACALATALTFTLASLATTSEAQTPRARPVPSGAALRFIGTWRLIAIEGDTGTTAADRGPHPTGLIYYDATGHMAAQIQPDRPRPAWSGRLPTPEQALDAIRGYTAYFGTYTIDEKARTVTHHRDGAINLEVRDYVRRYEFLPDGRLALTPVTRTSIRLIWERIK